MQQIVVVVVVVVDEDKKRGRRKVREEGKQNKRINTNHQLEPVKKEYRSPRQK
jgi:hypothetical protein